MDNGDYHTVGGEVYLSVRQTLLIDPEAYDVKSDWLDRPLNGRSTRDQITEVFQRFFNSISVNFGKAGDRGEPTDSDFLRQHPDGCNQIVTLSLFWLGLGYERIPRFPERIERGLFCRLNRVLRRGDYPDFLKRPISRARLGPLVNAFIRSKNHQFQEF